MGKIPVFVDGQEGTTGLKINEHLSKRSDVFVLKINPEKRKDLTERRWLLNEAAVAFLCLPDEAAREAVTLVDNPSTRIIDASTAHRVDDEWAYGLGELSREHHSRIAGAARVSVPGCYATGFTLLVYPLVREGILPASYPVTCHAVSGYSGGGKKLISVYESEDERHFVRSPCFYALKLQHKHLPEMQKHSGLLEKPLFTPIVADFYRGMTVTIPLHAALLGKKKSAAAIQAFYEEYYQGQTHVKVAPPGCEDEFPLGFMNCESCIGTNTVEILTFGNDKHILIAARLDNLGKGASLAAIQNMEIMMNLEASPPSPL